MEVRRSGVRSEVSGMARILSVTVAALCTVKTP